jgi:hypothetical protein
MGGQACLLTMTLKLPVADLYFTCCWSGLCLPCFVSSASEVTQSRSPHARHDCNSNRNPFYAPQWCCMLYCQASAPPGRAVHVQGSTSGSDQCSVSSCGTSAARVLQDVNAVLQHPATQNKLTSLEVDNISIRHISCFPQLCHLKVLQVKGLHLRPGDLLLMHQLSCLTSLTVEGLAGADTGQQGLQCSDLPPHLQLLCIRDLHLWSLQGWMNVLPAVSRATDFTGMGQTSPVDILCLVLWISMKIGRYTLLR